MLTNVFIDRYESIPIWSEYDEKARRFFNQAYRLITEQVFPLRTGNSYEGFSLISLTDCHDQLANELGVDHLAIPFSKGKIEDVISKFLTGTPQNMYECDDFIKCRISLIELIFRRADEELAIRNSKLSENLKTANVQDQKIAQQPPDAIARVFLGLGPNETVQESVLRKNVNDNDRIRSNIEELNTRFKQANFPLSYHGGFIQFADDQQIEAQIQQPFWLLLTDPKWTNVSVDMAEAIDRRDNKGRDAALYAAKALESTLKIISDEKGCTVGTEKGASNFIDNLVSKNKGRFIEVWEADMLKAFFIKVRNPLGHGAGNAPALVLTTQQDSWAIETCMSWIKSLISRM